MKSFEECLLLDFYGNLLTERMRSILELYLNDDLSLAEIAVTEEISRQGVHDTIKRALKQLHEYEDKLGLVARFSSEKKTVDDAIALLNSGKTDEAKELLLGLANELITE